jgi:hypothetical protein
MKGKYFWFSVIVAGPPFVTNATNARNAGKVKSIIAQQITLVKTNPSIKIHWGHQWTNRVIRHCALMNMKGYVTASLLPGHPEYFQICDCYLWTMSARIV